MTDRPPRHPSGKGIDLAVYYVDLRRIILAKLGRSIALAGLDAEDVISETARRILRANAGSHPYDPARASMSRYMVLQGTSALRNLIDSERRRARFESVGMQDREGIVRDVAALDIVGESPSDSESEGALSIAETPEEQEALVLLAEGVDHGVIREETGIDPCVLMARLRVAHLGEDDDVLSLFGER